MKEKMKPYNNNNNKFILDTKEMKILIPSVSEKSFLYYS